ncbi:hypothetical protein PoB_000423600 [Plakobranchus ocellatus]|uniref:Uncharacterized protein n=1 Tax=Plakobranchus ocellatus TaxID=259542 RepID=A0AAV3Y3F9_9GAST|nr:hypothetical protein PoB_000423600 [Plakobranchus ocellatus]
MIIIVIVVIIYDDDDDDDDDGGGGGGSGSGDGGGEKNPLTPPVPTRRRILAKRPLVVLSLLPASVPPFVSWSQFKKSVVISPQGSAKVADRLLFEIPRELKSILGDETIEITKLGSGDHMVDLKSNDQAKKLGAIATFLDIPVTVSSYKRAEWRHSLSPHENALE